MEKTRTVVALTGNPNVGKSTIFNGLTGLRQHTGNWPGKTVALARSPPPEALFRRRAGTTFSSISPASTPWTPVPGRRR